MRHPMQEELRMLLQFGFYALKLKSSPFIVIYSVRIYRIRILPPFYLFSFSQSKY